MFFVPQYGQTKALADNAALQVLQCIIFAIFSPPVIRNQLGEFIKILINFKCISIK